jgi:DNA-binding transcriptional ArsR family regulator
VTSVTRPSNNPKWALEKTVRDKAKMPPNAKYIMLVLLTFLDKDNGNGLEIGKFSPSIRKLASITGLNKSTVEEHVRLLIQQGWVTRSVVDRNKVRYTLAEGRSFSGGCLAQPDSKGVPATQTGVSGSAAQGCPAEPDRGVRVESPLPAQTPHSDRETSETEGQTGVQDHFGFANGRAPEDSALASDDSPAEDSAPDPDHQPPAVVLDMTEIKRGRRAGWGPRTAPQDQAPAPAEPVTLPPAPVRTARPVLRGFPDEIGALKAELEERHAAAGKPEPPRSGLDKAIAEMMGVA